MKDKKVLILVVVITVILLFTVGVTYAFLNYSQTGTSNSQLIVGDIYMHFQETNQLTIINAMPQSTYDTNNYFEFTIDGKNTYTKEDIWYEIVLSYGDSHATRTERIRDDLLKFRLVEVVDGVEQELFNNKSYNDLTNRRVWVDTIPKNTLNEVVHTYRLYMWISDSVRIGNASDIDYDIETWNNEVYASIKVNVTGDFNEKVVETEASCFETEIYTYYEHNSNITEEEVNLCVNYLTSNWGPEEDNTEEGETYESFCQGTGTPYGATFQEMLDAPRTPFNDEDLIYFEENNIIIGQEGIAIKDYDASCGSDVIIPKTINGYPVTMITTQSGIDIPRQIANKISNRHYSNNLNYRNKEYNVTELVSEVFFGAFEGKGLTSVIIPDSVIYIGTEAFIGNNLTSVIIPDSVKVIGDYAFRYNYLTSVVISNSVIYIGTEAFIGNNLTSVIIPDSVKVIGDYAFGYNDLTSVVIPNSVTYINIGAFRENNLTSVVIPNSVTYIDIGAFQNNQLTSVIIENGVEAIDSWAFADNNLTAVTIPDSVISLACSAFDDTVEITKRDDLVCIPEK